MVRVLAVWVLIGLLSGCSDEGGRPATSSNGGVGPLGGSGKAGAGSGFGGTTAGGAAGGSSSGTSGGGELVPLPPGSREVEGVVNLVDAAAAQELATFLTVEDPVFVTRRQDLVRSFNLFVEHYLEEYDFVFIFSGGPIENARAAGIFQALNRPAEPGGTSEIEVALGGYRTNGRTKGVIAINYEIGFYGPLAHEIGHHWANDLDGRFGFGLGLDVDFGPHWGFSSVNGQLGGFDGATLRCETPAGALPPGCTPLASGRTRYVVGDFAPFTNTYRSVEYAPLELYLMGLMPASEVPSSFQLLTAAEIVERTTEPGGTVVIEADGVDTVSFSDIAARHGQKRLLPPAERAFRAAFVVVSAEPASDAFMNDVAKAAAAFGNRAVVPNWTSFETHTGGRATLDTRLGSRRDALTPAPAPRELFECDVVAQDCPRPELACVLYPPSFCALSGSAGLDETCDASFACAPGLACVASNENPTAFMCKPYCDSTNASSPKSCEVLCPGKYTEYRATDGRALGGLCFP